jgi:hypothetical protein
MRHASNNQIVILVLFSMQEKVKDVSLAQLLRYNAPEWYFIVIGCIGSITFGGLQPVPAILFGSILGVSFSLMQLKNIECSSFCVF